MNEKNTSASHGQVAICARGEAELQAVAKPFGAKCHTIVADLSTEEGIKERQKKGERGWDVFGLKGCLVCVLVVDVLLLRHILQGSAVYLWLGGLFEVSFGQICMKTTRRGFESNQPANMEPSTVNVSRTFETSIRPIESHETFWKSSEALQRR